MASLDIYQLTFNQSFLGQRLTNVFFYAQIQQGDPTNYAEILGQEFNALFVTQNGGTAFDSVAFSDDLEANSINVRNLFNEVEFSVQLLGFDGQGANTGVNDNPFVAYRLTAPRLRGDMRNGQKYFGGLCVGAAANGEINATNFAALDSLVTACNTTLSVGVTGGTASFEPVVVKRIFVPATEEKAAHYRLPENLQEANTYDAQWVKQSLLTTMNTRKVGRGS